MLVYLIKRLLLAGVTLTAILLFYINGYTVKEIAKITGSTQMAVKQHLSRGRGKLRQILER